MVSFDEEVGAIRARCIATIRLPTNSGIVQGE